MAFALLALFFLISLGFAQNSTPAAPALSERGSLFKIGHDVDVKSNELAENIISIGGKVTIEGEVKESVIVVGGSLTVSGKIGEDVYVFGGNVSLGENAVIGGDVRLSDGELLQSPSAQVHGQIRKDQFWPGNAEGWDRFGERAFRSVRIPSGVSFFVGLIMTLIFGLLLGYLMPKQLEAQANAIQAQPLKVFGWGILACLLFVPIVITLVLTILGILLIPLVVLAYVFAGLMGVIACSLFVGNEVSKRLQSTPMAMLAVLALGIVVLAVVRLIPVIGEILTLLLWLMGFGVVLSTRFGTHAGKPPSPQAPQ